jgi:hypothetical protein
MRDDPTTPSHLPLDEFGYPDDGDPVPRFVGELRAIRPGKRGRAGVPATAVESLEAMFAALNSAGRREFIRYHDPRSWDGLDYIPGREAEAAARADPLARAALAPVDQALAARAEAVMAGWDEDARAPDRAAVAELQAAFEAARAGAGPGAAGLAEPAAAPPLPPAADLAAPDLADADAALGAALAALADPAERAALEWLLAALIDRAE